MTRTVRIFDRLDPRTGRTHFDVVEVAVSADGQAESRDIALLSNRHDAIELARYCAELDPDAVLHTAETVVLADRRRMRRGARL